MKRLKFFGALLFCCTFLISNSSCAVILRDDRPQHQGWYKNSNNPHHPHSKNPGIFRGNHTFRK